MTSSMSSRNMSLSDSFAAFKNETVPQNRLGAGMRKHTISNRILNQRKYLRLTRIKKLTVN